MIEDVDATMDKAIEAVERDLMALRTGRASTSLVEGVKVAAYGTESPLNHLATINTPDATSIVIQPFDPNQIAAVEKAILAANIGMTPNSDGKAIRLRVPALTEETRKEMVKKAHAIAEHGRVSVRNQRRQFNDEIKKKEKAHETSEDEAKRLLDEIQKHTDRHIKRIDELMAAKEKEIMQV
jgi:ribosome recycling factor